MFVETHFGLWWKKQLPTAMTDGQWPSSLLDIARKTFKQRVTAPPLPLAHVHVMCSMYKLRMGI